MSAPSAPQLVFEGPDPERLLLEAWSIHGTQVRITEPVIVRRGGIGGFFAKEHYRIEVLPAAPMAPHARMVAPDAFSSPSPETPHLGYPAAAGPAPVPASSAPFEQATGLPVPGTPGPATSWALAELVAATEDEVNLHSAPQPSFEEILGKVAGALGDDPVTFDGRLPADPMAAPAAPSALHELLAGTHPATIDGTDPITAVAEHTAEPRIADPITAVTPVVPAPVDAAGAPAAEPQPPAGEAGTAAMDAGVTSPAPDPSHLSSAALDRPVLRSRPWTLADAALTGGAEPVTAGAPVQAEAGEAGVAAEAAAEAGVTAEAGVPAEVAPGEAAPRGRHARRAAPLAPDDPQAATAQAAPRGRHARRHEPAELAPPAEQASRPRHARRDETTVSAPGTGGRAPASGSADELAVQLARIGFPGGLVAGAATAPRTLEAAFGLAPAAVALPDEPGSLVAVVGAPALARAVAELVGLAPDEVARARRGRAGSETASHLVAQDAATAAELAPTWRRGRVGVVAVAVGSPLEDGPWAATMLQAMRPTVTLAAASATMKPDDVRVFCAMLGGVDALAVEDLEATLSPASVLETGIPVAMLEGRPADAGAWVAAATWALARRSAAGA